MTLADAIGLSVGKPKLLFVENDEDIRRQLTSALQDEYALWFAADRREALTLLREVQPAVVSLNLGPPRDPEIPDEGFTLLDDIVQEAPQTRVVVVTGSRDREHVRRAVSHGAFDYHVKPIRLDELKVVFRRAASLPDGSTSRERVVNSKEHAVRFEDIIGSAPAMRGLFALIDRIAKADVTVLIEGESGTGKELVARALHSCSPRRNGAFIPIYCGAMPEPLLESELFGHERGAFAGAHAQRKGKFELADRGTLFLDEITDLPVPLQVKILRFLQTRIVERVGGRQSIPLDLRIIAATNRGLKSQMERGMFREDLYYRLSVVRVKVPPLRDRGEDVILLANTFLERAGQVHGREVRLGTEALRALLAYPWPGNVRELENRVNRAVIMSHQGAVGPADLDLEPAPAARPASLREMRNRVERETLVDALTRLRGNVSRAAQELKVSRPTVHSLLDKHQLSAKDFRRV